MVAAVSGASFISTGMSSDILTSCFSAMKFCLRSSGMSRILKGGMVEYQPREVDPSSAEDAQEGALKCSDSSLSGVM